MTADTANSPPANGSDRCAVTFWRGLKDAVPVMLAVAPFGLVLGTRAAHKGLGMLDVSLMTGLNFAGGSEFAAIELWTSPPHLVLIAAITLLINSRHIIMGAAIAPLVRHIPRRKMIPALFFMCDESWAVSLEHAYRRTRAKLFPAFSLRYYMGVSAGLYVTWIGVTTLGAVFGPLLGDIEKYGLDMAFPAVFLVLLRGMWGGWKAAIPWGVSLMVAAGIYLAVPGAWYVLGGTAAGLLTSFFMTGKAHD